MKTEPAVLTSLAVAIVSLLVSIGVPIDVEQREVVVTIVNGLLVLVGGFIIRQRVTPVEKLDQREPAAPLHVVRYGKRDR
jgi:hypothetical protein